MVESPAFVIALVVVATLLVVVFVLRSWMAVPQADEALVLVGGKGPRAVFGAAFAPPMLVRVERVSLRAVPLRVELAGRQGPISADGLRLAVLVVATVRVNRTARDVLAVAQTLGAARATDPGVLHELLDAMVMQATRTVIRRMEADDALTGHERVAEEILLVLGTDLDGYVLDHLAIEQIGCVPVELLDPNDILDAVAVKNLTARTAVANLEAAKLRREEAQAVSEHDLAAQEVKLRVERLTAEAEARQAREIAIVEARERAEAELVRFEEEARTHRRRVELLEQIMQRESAVLNALDKASSGLHLAEAAQQKPAFDLWRTLADERRAELSAIAAEAQRHLDALRKEVRAP